MPNVVLGVSGSVAAYRACDLARELMRRGFIVRVCLTDAAQRFVTPALFEALTGQPCLVDVFDEPERGRMAHIDWARQADALVIAPATASTLAKLAHGIADDMLGTIAVAATIPWVVAPAMNPSMYASDSVRGALEALRARAASIVEPVEGEVACGEQGQGKFASIDRIADEVQAVAALAKSLSGKSVLITSGPTQEPIDDVRFLSNRSSGRMGAALARAALLLGAEVEIVTGPASVPLPNGARVVRVQTAHEMLEAASRLSAAADLVIGVAAVADYRVADPVKGKVRRAEEPIDLRLVPNPDVIAELAKRVKFGARVIGFAAEPDANLDVARDKLARKGLYAIAANDVHRAMGGDRNDLTLLFADGRTEASGPRSKLECAIWLLRQVSADWQR